MVYRDAGHCIARTMSIETNDSTAKAAWQLKYKSGYPELPGEGSGLSAQERLTQDAMTRAMLHRYLTEWEWNCLLARFSINDNEVKQAVGWIIPRIESPAHYLFITKAVTAWAIPKRLPEAFYVLHSWDNDGTPERTLRRWKKQIHDALHGHVSSAYAQTERLMDLFGLRADSATMPQRAVKT